MTQSTPSATSASKRRASWFKHYQQWQASELTIAAYCSQHQLTQSSFYLWKQRFEQTDDPTSAVAHIATMPKSSRSVFIPVSTVPTAAIPTQSPLVLTLADVSLTLPRDTTETELSTWVRALRAS